MKDRYRLFYLALKDRSKTGQVFYVSRMSLCGGLCQSGFPNTNIVLTNSLQEAIVFETRSYARTAAVGGFIGFPDIAGLVEVVSVLHLKEDYARIFNNKSV